jgi:hypothetical protein
MKYNVVNKLRHITMLVFIFFFFIYNMIEYLREGEGLNYVISSGLIFIAVLISLLYPRKENKI